MSEEWVETTLGECCWFIGEKVDPSSLEPETLYVGLEHIEPGASGVRQGGMASQVTSLVSRFRAADTLFGRLRPYLKKVAFAETDGVCSPEVLVLRAKPGVCLPGFLNLLASSPKAIDHAVTLSAGSRMPRTSAADLASLSVLVPPLLVQHRIVDLMEHLDTHLMRLRVELEVLENLFVAAARDSVASANRAVPLGDVVDVRQGKSLPTSVQGQASGSVPWLKVADLGAPENRYGYRFGQTSLSAQEISDLGGQVLPVGSVVFPRVGAAVLTERKRVIEVPAAVDENHLVLCPTGDAAPHFVHGFMTSIRLADMVQSGAVPSLNMALVRSIPFPDVPLEEQVRVEEILKALKIAAENISHELRRLEALRSVLLDSLLTRRTLLPSSYDRLLSKVAS